MNKGTEQDDPVGRWRSMARGDLAYAEKSLALGSSFADKVCFHCQQAAEKALKALLVSMSIRPPKTHDIRSLLAVVTPA